MTVIIVSNYQTAKSTHHPHKIDDQHRECKTGGGAYFAFLLGSDNQHTTPQEYQVMRKVFSGDGACFAVPQINYVIKKEGGGGVNSQSGLLKFGALEQLLRCGSVALMRSDR